MIFKGYGYLSFLTCAVSRYSSKQRAVLSLDVVMPPTL